MNYAERGLYFDLLNHIYERGGVIPNNRDKLIRLSSGTPEEFDKAWPEVSKHIVPVESDETMLTNLVAKAHLERRAKEHDVSVEAGRRGGRPKKATLISALSPTLSTTLKGDGNQIERELELELERERETETHTHANASRCDAVCVSSSLSLSDPKTNPSPAKTEPTPEQVAWFSTWQGAFWKKLDRKRAFEAFVSRVTTQATFDAIMKATHEQTPVVMKRDPIYRPSPVAWLERELWLRDADT
jgi:hypothetical protein